MKTLLPFALLVAANGAFIWLREDLPNWMGIGLMVFNLGVIIVQQMIFKVKEEEREAAHEAALRSQYEDSIYIQLKNAETLSGDGARLSVTAQGSTKTFVLRRANTMAEPWWADEQDQQSTLSRSEMTYRCMAAERFTFLPKPQPSRFL